MTGPLSGVRVVVLAGMGPVPFLSMLLSDMGAEVVRVLRPDNRPRRALSQTVGLREETDVVNRGVGSVALDLKDPDSVEALLDVLATADVFVEGYRPGVVERLGLGPEVVLDRNPRIVYARLSGYGQSGALAHQAGHDINYVAQAGALHAMARQGEVPRPPINLLGDYAGGGTMAAFGVVAALFETARSGYGQVVDAAMVDGVALLTARLQGLRAADLFSDVAGTNYIDSGAPFYEVYRCRDGGYVAVGALEPEFYREFVKRLGVDTTGWPEQNDREQWPELRQLIAAALALRTREEWAQVYEGTDACVTPVLTFDEAAEHPHNRARELYTQYDGVLHPASAPRLSRTPAACPRPAGRRHEDLQALRRTWAPA
ncbi:CaiB/BaiF CoA-transferase family protein [Kribbella sp. NPDC051137]|uniref:CaiB/BaiF CoA transferase family protein n=1 Tax=Kribbella sp. NPDC051137 TaxID=3155045 RepID=UPI003444F99F